MRQATKKHRVHGHHRFVVSRFFLYFLTPLQMGLAADVDVSFDHPFFPFDSDDWSRVVDSFTICFHNPSRPIQMRSTEVAALVHVQ